MFYSQKSPRIHIRAGQVDISHLDSFLVSDISSTEHLPVPRPLHVKHVNASFFTIFSFQPRHVFVLKQRSLIRNDYFLFCFCYWACACDFIPINFQIKVSESPPVWNQGHYWSSVNFQSKNRRHHQYERGILHVLFNLFYLSWKSQGHSWWKLDSYKLVRQLTRLNLTFADDPPAPPPHQKCLSCLS